MEGSSRTILPATINNTILQIMILMATSMAIDDSRAKEIATKFLEQHYSIIGVGDAILENNIWKVVVKVSSFGVQIKTVLVHAKTGAIHEYF